MITILHPLEGRKSCQQDSSCLSCALEQASLPYRSAGSNQTQTQDLKSNIPRQKRASGQVHASSRLFCCWRCTRGNYKTNRENCTFSDTNSESDIMTLDPGSEVRGKDPERGRKRQQRPSHSRARRTFAERSFRYVTRARKRVVKSQVRKITNVISWLWEIAYRFLEAIPLCGKIHGFQCQWDTLHDEDHRDVLHGGCEGVTTKAG